jgi:hypothetical protein
VAEEIENVFYGLCQYSFVVVIVVDAEKENEYCSLWSSSPLISVGLLLLLLLLLSF